MISHALGDWSPLDLILLGSEVAGFCEIETLMSLMPLRLRG
jgi:hypothetical protein